MNFQATQNGKDQFNFVKISKHMQVAEPGKRMFLLLVLFFLTLNYKTKLYKSRYSSFCFVLFNFVCLPNTSFYLVRDFDNYQGCHSDKTKVPCFPCGFSLYFFRIKIN